LLYLFILRSNKKVWPTASNSPLGRNHSVFVAPAFVVLKSTSGTMISVPPNEYVYLSAKPGLLKVALKPS